MAQSSVLNKKKSQNQWSKLLSFFTKSPIQEKSSITPEDCYGPQKYNSKKEISMIKKKKKSLKPVLQVFLHNGFFSTPLS